MADRKEDLYGKLEQLRDRSFDKEEEALLFEIKTLEERLKEQLHKKRDVTKQELGRITHFKGGLKSYRQVKKKGPGRHFCIKG